MKNLFKNWILPLAFIVAVSFAVDAVSSSKENYVDSSHGKSQIHSVNSIHSS